MKYIMDISIDNSIRVTNQCKNTEDRHLLKQRKGAYNKFGNSEHERAEMLESPTN